MGKTLIVGLKEVYSGRGSKAVVGKHETWSIHDGAILIEDGMIAEISERECIETRIGRDVRVIDMGGKVAIPCFVDPHTHLVFGGDRSDEFNRRLHGETYQAIAASGGGIKSTVRHTRQADAEELFDRGKSTLDLMLLHGIGTIEAKSGYGLDKDAEFKQLDVMDRLDRSHPIEISQTFLGAHEVPPEFAGRPSDFIQHVNEEMLPEVAKRGSVRYVDIFCEKGVFELEDSRRHLEKAKELGFDLRIHADELFPLGGAGLAAELGAKTADHLVHASPADMEKMANAGTMAILLPGTSFFLRGPYADASLFKQAGCPFALSTDFNPGSSHTISQALMMALGCMNMGLTFEEAFVAVTLNAAASLDYGARIGTLEPGKQADITFLDAPSAMHLVYYWGLNHVSDVIKGGQFVVRNRQICY